jgi:hypothetical protein
MKKPTLILLSLFSHNTIVSMKQNHSHIQEIAVIIEELESKDCSICLENIKTKKKIILPCKHELHRECFEQLFTRTEEYATKCPECRRSYISDEFKEIIKLRVRSQQNSRIHHIQNFIKNYCCCIFFSTCCPLLYQRDS